MSGGDLVNLRAGVLDHRVATKCLLLEMSPTILCVIITIQPSHSPEQKLHENPVSLLQSVFGIHLMKTLVIQAACHASRIIAEVFVLKEIKFHNTIYVAKDIGQFNTRESEITVAICIMTCIIIT